MKKRDLLARINVLEEQNRRRGEGETKLSKWYILLNPNTHVDNSINMTAEYIEDSLLDMVNYLGDHLDEVIVFNKHDHGWYKPHIESVHIKVTFEKGEGRRKKDGTYPEKGGFIHCNVKLRVIHRSNISINYGKLRNLLMPRFELAFGKRGLIGTPKLLSKDQSERYMLKDKRYKRGYKWVTITREPP